MNQPDLGKKVLELRQNRGMTQSELADNCNLSLRTIQRIESMETTPRDYTIRVIFSNLGYEEAMSLPDNPASVSQKTTRLKQFFIKYILDFFNFKTNTMKKVSVLSLVVLFVTVGLFLAKSDELKAQKIEGWFLAGSKPGSYKIGLDKSVYKTGSSSALLESIDEKIDGFGTLMQTCLADDYLGKRVKMTGYIKSKDVSGWAGMWMRVDAKNERKTLSFDNMRDRPIKGSNDWTKYEIVLDVPAESGTLNFGVLLDGTGKIWFDSVSFEIVSNVETKPTGSGFRETPKKPTNLNFGE